MFKFLRRRHLERRYRAARSAVTQYVNFEARRGFVNHHKYFRLLDDVSRIGQELKNVGGNP